MKKATSTAVLAAVLATSSNPGYTVGGVAAPSPSSGTLADLFSIERDSDLLRGIDPDTAATVSSVPITLTGEIVDGGTGLTAKPGTNELWALLKLSGQGGRELAIINPVTGVATSIGDTDSLQEGHRFAGIAFNGDGSTLYAVSGDGSFLDPESLFTLSQIDGSPTFVCFLGNGTDGETIAWNPDNDTLYHASGHDGVDVIFETVDNALAPGKGNCSVTNIPITAPLTDEEAQAITYWNAQDVFLWKQDHGAPGPLFRVTANGAATLIGDLDHTAKGLAFLMEPPINDDCVDRIEITNGVTPFSTINGTPDGPVPCGPGGADIWFNYNSEFTGTLVVTTCDSVSDHDTALAVYDGCGCPASLDNLLACDDNSCGLQSRVEVPVVAGNCYKIQVFGLAGDITIFGFEEAQETQAAGEVTAQAIGDFDVNSFTDVIAVVPTGAGAAGVPGAVQVFLNQGTDKSGVWQGLVAIDPVTVGVEPRAIAVGFFNMDEFPDVAVTNATDNSVSILINQGTGDGTFNPPVTIEMVGERPTGIVAGDFTEDALVDLAVALELDEAVVLLIGDGRGGFSPPAGAGGIGGLGLLPVMLIGGDFDGNKCPDVTGGGNAGVAGPIQGQVFVALGQLGGGFGRPAFYNVGLNPVQITSGDLNQDGFAEIIVANNDDASLTILINNGEGLFGTSVTEPVGSSPESVEAVDLTGDDVADLAVTAIDPVIGQAVQVLENITAGQTPDLGEPIAFGVNAEPNFVVSSDLNNDGAADLVTGNTDDDVTGGSVTALISTPPPPPVCPWDCGNGDGEVGIVDFLALLAQWGQVGTACDFDGGGVGIVDFLKLLANWGPCT